MEMFLLGSIKAVFVSLNIVTWYPREDSDFNAWQAWNQVPALESPSVGDSPS